jgi:hypothetical protein
MRFPRFQLFLLVAVALLSRPPTAHGCSCPPGGPPCQAAYNADVVFAGVVRTIQPDQNPDEPDEQVVRLDVERGFINATRGAVELKHNWRSTCAYRFVTGQRYLVYALRTPSGRLVPNICSTKLLKDAAADVAYLTSMARAPAGARIFGRVNEYGREPADERGIDYGPLEGVAVTVRTATIVRTVTTDADGRYEVAALPPGPGSLTLTPPAGFGEGVRELDFDLPDARACWRADFTLSPSAAASGAVVDASGHPLAGIRVEAVAAELAGFSPPPYHSPAVSDARGAFTFDRLPPGRYVFGVDLTSAKGRGSPGAALFLPGTRSVADAAIFDLKAGERVDVGVMTVRGR